MPLVNEPDERLTLVYLLSLWRETTTSPWRASLRAAGEDGRMPFPDLETLARYLLTVPEGLSSTVSTDVSEDHTPTGYDAGQAQTSEP